MDEKRSFDDTPGGMAEGREEWLEEEHSKVGSLYQVDDC
jgi:hypothetical protein